MTTKKTYVTAEGLEALKMKLKQLREEKQPTLLKQLQEAQGGADWMGSAEFSHIQDNLVFINSRIRELEDIIAQSILIEPHNDDNVVDLGDTAVLQANGDLETYTIVGSTEADPSRGFISNESPLGQALLQKKVGDAITVEAPIGLLHFRIIAVK